MPRDTCGEKRILKVFNVRFGLVIHAGGNMLSAFNLFAQGRSEWQPAAESKPLIWATGPDAAFWTSVVAVLFIGAGAVWAYVGLAGVTRAARTRVPPDQPELPGPAPPD